MMDIKLPTVKTHVSHILTKLGGGKPQKRGENRGKEAQAGAGAFHRVTKIPVNKADSMTQTQIMKGERN